MNLTGKNDLYLGHEFLHRTHQENMKEEGSDGKLVIKIMYLLTSKQSRFLVCRLH